MIHFVGNQPSRPLRSPHRRHYVHLVTFGSRPRLHNTVILSWVPVRSDVDAINQGRAVREGNTFLIHDRRYGAKPEGLLYPIDGPGFYRLDRGAYKALGIYNDLGLTDAAEMRLDLERISRPSRAVAREVLAAERRGL